MKLGLPEACDSAGGCYHNKARMLDMVLFIGLELVGTEDNRPFGGFLTGPC